MTGNGAYVHNEDCKREKKRYLKTDYQVHCTEESSPCKDHCRKFALSDPVEKDFKEDCDHGHHHVTCVRTLKMS